MNRFPITRRCPLCAYAVEDPSGPAPGQPVIVGTPKRMMCLAHPPSSSTIPTQHGLVSITSYPAVNKDSISCAMFAEAKKE